MEKNVFKLLFASLFPLLEMQYGFNAISSACSHNQFHLLFHITLNFFRQYTPPYYAYSILFVFGPMV
jgi:hypothetical protein